MASSPSSPPPFPPGVRLATLSDIPRLAVVAAAGCFHSSIFNYVRPLCREYPVDTIAGFRWECMNALLDPRQMLIVVEDEYEADEIETVDGVLKATVRAYQDEGGRGKVVVGYAAIDLTNDAERIGTFQPVAAEDELLKDPLHLGRDVADNKGQLLLNEEVYRQHSEVFVHRMKLLRLAVHPRYLRRGHGRKLTQWWVDLADRDGIEACVLASTLGRLVYEAVGFEKVLVKEVSGHKNHPEKLEVWVGVRYSRR